MKISRRIRRTEINQETYSEVFLESPENAVLFLDFDGTLAPLQEKPDHVHLPENRLQTLKSLSLIIPVFVLSGRSIPDLEKRLPVTELAGVSGDHGASRMYRGEIYLEPNAENARDQLIPLASIFEKIAGQWPGVILERKQFSLSVHYRQLVMEKREEFISLMAKTFRQVNTKNIEMRPGKCVLEFRHTEINKESALKWFYERVCEESGKGQASVISRFPIMIGDDTTDLNAVKTAIALGGIGIWVGDTFPDRIVSNAARLSSPEHVWAWLDRSWKIPS